MTSRRDVEDDIRHLLARDAQICVKQLRDTNITSVDAVLDYLVSRSYSSPRRLLEAHVLLGEEDQGARALLLRASRRAADPQPPQPPRPYPPPDANRFSH